MAANNYWVKVSMETIKLLYCFSVCFVCVCVVHFDLFWVDTISKWEKVETVVVEASGQITGVITLYLCSNVKPA